MCRLLGIVSSEPTEFRLILREAPRSLAALSREHPDGWGLAIHDGNAGGQGGWQIHRGVRRAHDDEEFHRLAVGSRGELLVAHIRQRTVGTVSLENTHPFQRGRWLFAHNGTIEDLAWLRSRTSGERLAEVRGETDSELFFAYLLTRLDERGLTEATAGAATDETVRDAAREARERPGFGAFNFLLSDGATLYAHRFGRTLCLLERRPHDEVRTVRRSETGAVIETPWSRRRHAVLLASEQLTDEPWEPVAEGVLLRLERGPEPTWRVVT